MNVNALVDAFKRKRFGTAPVPTEDKRTRDEFEASESVEPAESAEPAETAEPAEPAETADDAFALANRQLPSVIGIGRLIESFRCEASENAFQSMLWLMLHLRESAQSSFGQWMLFLKLLSADEYATRKIQGSKFPLYEVYESYGDASENARRDALRRNMPQLYDDAMDALVFKGYLQKQDRTLLQAQQQQEYSDYNPDDNSDDQDDNSDYQDDNSDDNSDDDQEAAARRGAQNSGSYADLLLRCLDATASYNRARAELQKEDHSPFAHAYDFVIVNEPEGGDSVHVPSPRSYFYRVLREGFDGSRESDSKSVPQANRNADLAAGLRMLVLQSVVLSYEASKDSGCAIVRQLNAEFAHLSHPAAFGLIESRRVAELVERVHEWILKAGEDMAHDEWSDRFEGFKAFRSATSAALAPFASEIASESASERNPNGAPNSPLLGLLVKVCSLMVGLCAARYAILGAYPRPQLVEKEQTSPGDYAGNYAGDAAGGAADEVAILDEETDVDEPVDPVPEPVEPEPILVDLT